MNNERHIASVLNNEIYLFVAWRRKAPTASSAKLDDRYK